jgi:hypothetical protein
MASTMRIGAGISLSRISLTKTIIRSFSFLSFRAGGSDFYAGVVKGWLSRLPELSVCSKFLIKTTTEKKYSTSNYIAGIPAKECLNDLGAKFPFQGEIPCRLYDSYMH